MAKYYRTERVGFRFPAHPYSRCRVSGVRCRSARSCHRPDTQHPAPDTLGGGGEGGGGFTAPYSSNGSISWGKLLRARLRRLLTVPRLPPVMSAISENGR